MPTITQVGNELQEIPFGELLQNVAQGIADGQQALDKTSLMTLVELSQTMVELIPEMTEVMTPEPRAVNVPGHAPVEVTGVHVDASAAQPIQMSALQAGLTPTFYQFTEATIEAKVSIQLREVQTTDTQGKKQTGLAMFASNVNFRTQNTYSYSAEAACSVNAVLRPVPAPARAVPSTVVVNALGPQPTVSVTP
ncbi:MAG TPA: hypothetical protein VFJ24_06835 [Gaiellales bacterium]|nr:hypothetical protein [Gaiellales bacterium]